MTWTIYSPEPPPQSVPLSAVREWLLEHTSGGEAEQCPACEQNVKVYRRSVNAAMASALIALYRECDLDYGYIPSILGTRITGDFAKMRYWGLIAAEPDLVRADGSTRVGRWRVTEKGRAWVLGLDRIHRYARTYDGKCLGVEGEPWSVRDALGTEFNYDDLMGQRWDPDDQGTLL